MRRAHYSFERNQSFTIRGTAKLLNVASSRYGGDWHSARQTVSVPWNTGKIAKIYKVPGNTVIIREDLEKYRYRP